MSSRSPSPAERVQEFLTPRSKIRQVLAAADLDLSSDEDSTPKQKTARKVDLGAKSTGSTTSPVNVDSDDDDDDIVRPRGKFAARMLAQSKPQNTEPESQKSPVDARERVRRILQQTQDEEDSNAGEDLANSDGASDVVSRPKKLKPRRQRSATPASNPPSSPGLFVTPSKAQSPTAKDAASSDSDADLPMNPIKNLRLQAILDRKRKERQAREAEEARKKEARLERATTQDLMSEGESAQLSDGDQGDRQLSQEGARPTRKASKKALEEMNRETQRIARNMQLVHEAKTKKKVSKSELFERFNFRVAGALPRAAEKTLSSSRCSSPVSVLHTDSEGKDQGTPPSSPPSKSPAKSSISAPVPSVTTDSKDIQQLTAPLAQDPKPKTPAPFKGKLSDKFRAVHTNLATLEEEDDDELEIVPAPKKSRIDAIFDSVPLDRAKASRPLHALRALAQLTDPDKKHTAHGRKGKAQQIMSAAEARDFLAQRARDQAKEERDRRVEMLASRGIHIQTADEREREMAEVEDMVARARREAEEIMQRERQAAKEEKRANRQAGEADPLAWDDSDDDDASYQEEVELEAVELSGSDDEAEGEDEDEEMGSDNDSDKEAPADLNLFDEAAAESNDDSEDQVKAGDATAAVQQQSDDETGLFARPRRQPRKRAAVISDDEDEQDLMVESTPRPKSFFPKSPADPGTVSPKIPTSVLRSATKTFIPGLPVAGAAAGGLGLTQIFAGTMDDSQLGPVSTDFSGSMPRPTFEEFPDSNFSQTAEAPADDLILDSQAEELDTQGTKINLSFSQSQAHDFHSLLRQDSQLSEMIEPSQDQGYMGRTPITNRFIEPASTIHTVIPGSQMPAEDGSESPLVKRAGKLRRRGDQRLAREPSIIPASDAGTQALEADEPEEDEFGFGTVKQSETAFSVMKDAAQAEKKRNKMSDFNKKESNARAMVEEQAEESEDEYAGIGGADGEDSDDEDDASVKDMFDDETKNTEADERQIAALHADRVRAADEKQVNKLFHDLTTGQLRRKRRGSFGSLSDSDDGGEARRRMKRRQFARAQKALYADERVSKVAENPRTQAFMRTMQDMDDDDMDFVLPATTVPATQSQSQSQSQSQDVAAGLSGDVAIPDSQPLARAPAHQRRTRPDKKPATLGEVRQSLSELLGDVGVELPVFVPIIPKTADGSDGESDEGIEMDNVPSASNKENRNPRRTGSSVVDRITLKRNNSSALSSMSSGAPGRLAFAATGGSNGIFKVPALLRKATTSSLMSSAASNTGVTTHEVSSGQAGVDGAFGAEAKVKKNASRGSGINFFARENDRRAAVAEKDRRREAKKVHRAAGRSEMVGNVFKAGTFE